MLWDSFFIFLSFLTVCLHYSAAQLGQKVAVLDYVEPSAKGKTFLMYVVLVEIPKL